MELFWCIVLTKIEVSSLLASREILLWYHVSVMTHTWTVIWPGCQLQEPWERQTDPLRWKLVMAAATTASCGDSF